MFSKSHVNLVEAELARTLAAISDWKKNQGATYTHAYTGDVIDIPSPKQNAALRRASLDLSRALSALRQA